MDRSEMGKVVMFVNSLERRTMTEDEVVVTAIAWHELIGHLDYEDVREAVKEVFMNPDAPRFFRPSDVAYLAKRRSTKRFRPLDERAQQIQARYDRQAAERRAIEQSIEIKDSDPVGAVAEAMTKETN